MSDPFTQIRLMRERYQRLVAKHHDRVIALHNLISKRNQEERDPDIKGIYESIINLMHMIGLLDDDNYKDEE